jgi:Mg/Co/Ni transporter MgtE
MTTDMVACQPNEDILRAADLMEEHQVRRIPVVDQQGVLQGMISTADICQRANLSSDYDVSHPQKGHGADRLCE